MKHVLEEIDTLERLKEKLREDESLPLRGANAVFGEGNPRAEVVFVGEAPGFYEDREGRPFVGQAGKLLDKLIDALGWKRKDVYITNVLKRRPPGNRDPLPEEIEAYAPYLTRELLLINPKLIVPLGRFAMNYFLPAAKISRDQGRVFWWDGHLVVPLYHPAAALRSGAVLEDLETSFQTLPGVLQNFEALKKKYAPAKEAKQERLF